MYLKRSDFSEIDLACVCMHTLLHLEFEEPMKNILFVNLTQEVSFSTRGVENLIVSRTMHTHMHDFFPKTLLIVIVNIHRI